MTTPSPYSVLIVDDEPTACDIIEGFLEPEGYERSIAHSGAEAFTCLEKSLPDIILLDLLMPEMDGFEVCERLKTDKRWQHLPVILVTALDSTEDLVRGLDAGADDFLKKPVDGVELRARVRTQLRVKQQYDELQNTVRLREDLTHMIVHDIRTPLTAILGYSELLLTKSLPAADVQDISGIRTQAYRLDGFLNDMLLLAKLEAERLILNRSMVDVNQLVQKIKESYDVVSRSKMVKLMVDLPATAQHILLDANLFQRMLENLISNALKFSPPRGTVTVRVDYPRAKTLLYASVPRVRVQVFDEGPGIGQEYRDRIFQKFEIVKLKEQGDAQVGLGLAFCKMVVEAHGGQISVEPNRPQGSVFRVEV